MGVLPSMALADRSAGTETHLHGRSKLFLIVLVDMGRAPVDVTSLRGTSAERFDGKLTHGGPCRGDIQ